MKKLILFLCCLLTAVSTWAYDFSSGDIYYNFTSSTDPYTVAVTSGATTYYGDVIIPDSVKFNNVTYAVTSIGANAFNNCTSLSSLTIPKTVAKIDIGAFSGCVSMTKVTCLAPIPPSLSASFIPKTLILVPCSSVNLYKANSKWGVYIVGGSIFTVNGISYQQISCNDSVQVLPSSSYTGAISIPSTVDYGGHNYTVSAIANSAFQTCTGLTSISIPNTISTIGNKSFYGCTGLSDVTLSGSISSIGDYAFYGCTGLSSISLPNTINNIGDYAFQGCTNLSSVVLPAALTAVKLKTFHGCTRLRSVSFSGSVTTIGDYAFYGCSSLSSVSLPNSITSIGGYAFQACSGLSSIVLPTALTSIKTSTFSGCSSLTSINLPSTITTIEDYALKGTALTALTLPSSLSSIGNSAFNGCNGLTFVKCMAVTPPSLGTSAFPTKTSFFVPCGSITQYKADFNWSAYTLGVFSINGILYQQLSCDEVSVMPSADYTGAINIPSTVAYEGRTYKVSAIAGSAFSSSVGLTSVNLPSTLTSIGASAFANTSLSNIIIRSNSNLKMIYNKAFYSTKIKSIAITAKVDSIGYGDTFDKSTSLSAIYCYGNTPAGLRGEDKSDFSAIDLTKCVLYVPLNTKAKYKVARQWSTFSNIVELDYSLRRTINVSAGNLSSLISATDRYALANLTLTGTIDARDISYIRDSLYNLKNLDLTRVSIAEYTGVIDSTLSKADITYAANTLPSAGLKNLSTLQSLRLPSSLTAIGAEALSGCSSLASIYTYNSTPIDLSSSVNVFSGIDTTTCVLHVRTNEDLYGLANQWKSFNNIKTFKIKPLILWSNPIGITYGTALSSTQLNAIADVLGSFVYTPSAGIMLNAGSVQKLYVSFVPTDLVNYESTMDSVLIDVAKVIPTITWTTPADITYGVALSSAQLNATSDAPGNLIYTPSAGTMLNAGSAQKLYVSFVPTDPVNYESKLDSVTINVAKVNPTIIWPTPAGITYGAALSSTQLNATSDAPGNLIYTPSAGTILNAGTQKLYVSFIPTDLVNYESKLDSVLINVAKVIPTITWPTPADITYGTALSSTQLNATSDMPGSFVYAPAAGTILNEGKEQIISAIFIPLDPLNYTVVSSSVKINVTPSIPTSIETTLANAVKIYPNPCINEFTVNIGDKSDILYLYNAEGQLLFTQQINKETRIDAAFLSKGVYLLRINGSSYKLTKK